MLPDTRQVGEPQIDHLNLLVLDRLEDILDRDTIRNHGFTPATESGVLKVTLPSDPLQSRRFGTAYTTPPQPLPASIRHHDTRVQSKPFTLQPAASALAPSAHQHH